MLFRGVDFLLFFVAGVAGCIVAFITFYSTHPCTSCNWNILWLHPLHLVAAMFFLLKNAHSFRHWYHLINFAVLILFLGAITIWNRQDVPATALPMPACLALRSMAWFRAERKERKERKKNR
jgi:hypothetical protein